MYCVTMELVISLAFMIRKASRLTSDWKLEEGKTAYLIRE
jgi:hypothetical protein